MYSVILRYINDVPDQCTCKVLLSKGTAFNIAYFLELSGNVRNDIAGCLTKSILIM